MFLSRSGIAFGLVLMAAAPAHAAGDADTGRAIADRWCAPCHGSSDGALRPQALSDRVPTFKAIANDKSRSDDRLRGFLAAPHPPMPNVNLTRDEIENVIAYIKSLRGK